MKKVTNKIVPDDERNSADNNDLNIPDNSASYRLAKSISEIRRQYKQSQRRDESSYRAYGTCLSEKLAQEIQRMLKDTQAMA